jgi:hypothetical protein
MSMGRKISREKKEAPRVVLEFSRAGMFLWGGAGLFLLVWVFALGVLAGRGLVSGDRAVEELKEQVARIQEIIRREEPRSGPQSDDPPSEGPRLSFYENLTAGKDEPQQGKPPAPPGSAGAAGPAASLKATVEQAPPSRVEPVRTGPEKPETGPGGLVVEARFTVQVAAVESRGAADEMVADLKRRGHPAYHYRVEADGKTFYRVRCGRFLSRAEAGEYAALLAQKEGINGFVSGFE